MINSAVKVAEDKNDLASNPHESRGHDYELANAVIQFIVFSCLLYGVIKVINVFLVKIL